MTAALRTTDAARRRTRRACVAIVAVLAITACRAPATDRRQAPPLATSVERDATRYARYPVTVDARYAPGGPKRVDDLAYSAPILRSAARDAIMYVRAATCWPETRDDHDLRIDLRERRATLRRYWGDAAAAVSCDAPKPRGLPSRPVCCVAETMPISALQQFAYRVPLATDLSFAIRQGEVPLANPPRDMRRRWRAEVRIAPTRDAVVDAALSAVLRSAVFGAAVGNLPIRLTDAQPNALLLPARAVAACGRGRLARDCDAIALRGTGRSLDGVRRTLDPLAARLTGGRRSWFRDGSDFAAAVPLGDAPSSGFTVGSRETIEAAVCFLPDEMLDPQWRASFPAADAASPAYRQRQAVECLLRILGVSGARRDMTTFPDFDDRKLDLVPVRGRRTGNKAVVLGRLGLGALQAIYGVADGHPTSRVERRPRVPG